VVDRPVGRLRGRRRKLRKERTCPRIPSAATSTRSR
jgi:hypothetical protein